MGDKNRLTKPGAGPSGPARGHRGFIFPVRLPSGAVEAEERRPVFLWLVSASSRLQLVFALIIIIGCDVLGYDAISGVGTVGRAL